MVIEVTDQTIVGAQIQSAFVLLRMDEKHFHARIYPTRVHGPTGKLEYWLPIWHIYKLAQEAELLGLHARSEARISLSAIGVRLATPALVKMPVKGVQYEENFNGIKGAWG